MMIRKLEFTSVRWLMLLAGMALSAIPSMCLAQLTPGAGGSLRPTEPVPQGRAQPRLDIPVLESSAVAQTVAGKIGRFKFSGITVVPVSELEAVVAPWLGKELSAADLTNVLNAVTSHMRERGLYAAQAYLPKQDAANGEVEIAVLEGRVGKVGKASS